MRSCIVLIVLCVTIRAYSQTTQNESPGTVVPHLIKQTGPIYPPIAKAAHVSGEVKLSVQIGKDGDVVGVKPISGPPMLIGAAEDCVKQWVYEPTLIDGAPAPTSTIATIEFSLPAPINPNDMQIAQKFFPLQQACVQAVSSNTDTGQQASVL